MSYELRMFSPACRSSSALTCSEEESVVHDVSTVVAVAHELWSVIVCTRYTTVVLRGTIVNRTKYC